MSCFLAFSCSDGFALLFVSAFEHAFTSSSLFKLASVVKDFYLEVAIRVLAQWDASLLPGKAQWCNLCATSLAEVAIGKAVGVSVAKAKEDLQVAVAGSVIGIFRG